MPTPVVGRHSRCVPLEVEDRRCFEIPSRHDAVQSKLPAAPAAYPVCICDWTQAKPRRCRGREVVLERLKQALGHLERKQNHVISHLTSLAIVTASMMRASIQVEGRLVRTTSLA